LVRFGVGGVDDSGDACAIAPLIAARGRDVVPSAAVLVIGDDNGCVRPLGAVLHGMDDVGHMLLPLQQVGIARMLVIRPKRLDKTDGGQVAAGQIAEEIRLVLQVGIGVQESVVLGVGGPIRVEGSVVGVVGKRLMVVLE